MAVRLKYLLPLCLVLLVSSTALALKGEIQLATPTGGPVEGRYDVQWGHFALTRDSRRPTFLDVEWWRPWRNNLPTWTFVGSVILPEKGKTVCEFAIGGLRYETTHQENYEDRTDSYLSDLKFEAPCRNLRNYKVSVEISEERRSYDYDTGINPGWTSRPALQKSYRKVKEEFWLGLSRFSPDSGWKLLGTAKKSIR